MFKKVEKAAILSSVIYVDVCNKPITQREQTKIKLYKCELLLRACALDKTMTSISRV